MLKMLGYVEGVQFSGDLSTQEAFKINIEFRIESCMVKQIILQSFTDYTLIKGNYMLATGFRLVLVTLWTTFLYICYGLQLDRYGIFASTETFIAALVVFSILIPCLIVLAMASLGIFKRSNKLELFFPTPALGFVTLLFYLNFNTSVLQYPEDVYAFTFAHVIFFAVQLPVIAGLWLFGIKYLGKRKQSHNTTNQYRS